MTKKMKDIGHIGVVMGGCSSERDISLKSGKGIYQALQESGCDVSAIDIQSTDKEDILAQLKSRNVAVVFLALHGKFGEDGTIQAILEEAGIPYTGSGPGASRTAMNKALTQQRLRESGIPVPAYAVARQDNPLGLERIRQDIGGMPVVVKPACEGSSIGITIVRDERGFREALDLAFQYGPEVLLERYIGGREITAGILDQDALPLVEIRPKHPFFDFTAKYQKGMTEYVVPAEIPADVTQRIQHVALSAYRAIGCRHFARVDFILDERDQPFVLEINTIPGFTATSLLPMSARAVGYEFSGLCRRIVELAISPRIP